MTACLLMQDTQTQPSVKPRRIQ